MYRRSMYRPSAFAVESPAEILDALRRISFGHLVTAGAGGGNPESTPLPFLVDDQLSEIRAHFARGNPHWKRIDGRVALMIVAGPDTYVSPRWYPSKIEHGRVVPTWNYEVIHVHGTVEICDDPSWKLDLVTALTDHHEPLVVDPARPEPWQVSDAPPSYTDAQLRAIVGIRLRVTSIEAKQKLSQSKSVDDRAGVINGLERSPRPDSLETATLMRGAGPS